MAQIWGRLTADPRDPRMAAIRATDSDRDEVLALLREAYADGRLARAEYDERTDGVLRVRTLGEIVPLVTDLAPAPAGAVARKPPPIVAEAERTYAREVRDARNGVLSIAVLTTGIWAVTSFASGGLLFFWPVFPVIGVGIGWMQIKLNRESRIESIEEKLAKRNRRRREDEQA